MRMRSFSMNFGRRLPLPRLDSDARAIAATRAAVRALNVVVQQIVDRAAPRIQPHKDLLSMMLHARDEDDGSRMTDAQLADEARTFLLAGHETTAIRCPGRSTCWPRTQRFRRRWARSSTACWAIARRRLATCRT